MVVRVFVNMFTVFVTGILCWLYSSLRANGWCQA